jgi:sugar phosphate isomerase/epimerase
MDKWPLGVFASIDAGLGVKLDVLRDLGVPTVQIHAPSPAKRNKSEAKDYVRRLSDMGIRSTAVFGGFEGESYADIPTVQRTIGLVPPDTRAARLAEMKEISDFAQMMDVGVVALHLGFVPEDASDAIYPEVIEVTRELCDHVQKNGQALHLETGQETAHALLRFIGDVGRDNLFINFDPANMILYGSGEPIEALRKVGAYVRSVHCKDARWAENPGKEWGQEVPLGEGQVGMENFLATLDEIGYFGPLTVEREIPQDPDRQKAEIGHAIQLLTGLKERIG